MIVHQPTRLAVFSAVVTAINAVLAAALGSLALAAALVVLLIVLILAYRRDHGWSLGAGVRVAGSVRFRQPLRIWRHF